MNKKIDNTFQNKRLLGNGNRMSDNTESLEKDIINITLKKSENILKGPFGNVEARCIICHNVPFLPVTWNIWFDNEQISCTKCPSSVKNMMCQTCARRWIDSKNHNSHFKYKNNILKKIKCPTGCCEGYYPKNEMYLYGSPTRNYDEGAEEFIWNTLMSYGCLNMTCPLCNYKCKDIDDLIMHPRISCSQRMAPCLRCKELVCFDEKEVHKKKCGPRSCFKFMC